MIQVQSHTQRVEALRRISDLFLSHTDTVTPKQIALFDDVLVHLVERVENKALAELGTRLAPIDNAPHKIIRHLASHDDIAVAAPVLSESSQLTDADLVYIARSKSQAHLLAMTRRNRLAEQVTDVLVERGSPEVVRGVAINAGASFSESGFTRLVGRAENDDVLAEQVGLRLDLPLPLLRNLLERATITVRSRILQSPPLEKREEVQKVIAAASNEVFSEATTPRDFTAAQELVLQLRQNKRLNEAAILEFANSRRFEEMVASLALICSAPIGMIERLMQNVRHDGLIIVCKAAELKWPTTSAILSNRFALHPISPSLLQEARADFIKLTVPTAQRILRFWLIREKAINQANLARSESRDIQAGKVGLH